MSLNKQTVHVTQYWEVGGTRKYLGEGMKIFGAGARIIFFGGGGAAACPLPPVPTPLLQLNADISSTIIECAPYSTGHGDFMIQINAVYVF